MEEGLSPRVRGNPGELGVPGPAWRSIPASAGEPPDDDDDDDDEEKESVYPRECGGTWAGHVANVDHAGLSPRVRGNLGWACSERGPCRSIPASAGEPYPPGCYPRTSSVYPRECGGTPDLLRMRRVQTGLSPRVRGNRTGRAEGQSSAGSIPASAGEPLIRFCFSSSIQVYPRECGGTRPLVHPVNYQIGLSPRVRGNLPATGSAFGSVRSIPASAGEPQRPCQRDGQLGVYPRECGGTTPAVYGQGQAEGLCPRVRGNHINPLGVLNGERSIPASAGEPGAEGPPTTTTPVYPRECGGTTDTLVVSS